MRDSKLRLAISRRQAATAIFMLLAILLLSRFVISNTLFSSWDFRNNLWSPSYLLVHGKSPYRIDGLFASGNAVWLPMIIGALFPLGYLPLQQASNLWFVGNYLGLFLLVWLSSGSRRPPAHLFALALATAFLFPPVIAHLRLGQLSIGITLLFLVVTLLSDRMPLFLATMLLAIALSKPQLAILVLPGFLVHGYRRKGGRHTILFVVLLLASILLLTTPLYAAHPSWYVDFLTELQQNPDWVHPSSLTVLTSLTSRFGRLLWLALALFVFSLNIWLWVTLPDRVAVLWSLALTPLITPYVWTWDFVMILPLFVAALFNIQLVRARWFLLLGYLVCWTLIVRLLFGGVSGNEFYWWVPWMMLAVIVSATAIDRSADRQPL